MRLFRAQDTRSMTEGPILKQLILFSVPLLIGNLFQQLYNTVDSIVVGNFVGSEGLAAVGSSAPIINTLVGLFSGLATGGTVVISQYFGARDTRRLQDAVHTTIMMILILSVAFTFLGVWIAPLMLRMMNTPENVFPQANEYLTIYFAGLSGLMIYNIGAGILRAVGDSRRPLYFLLVSSVLNIVLDLVFVINFNMGVAGVAYATIIAQFVSAGLILMVLMRTHAEYKLRFRHLRMDMPILKRIVFIGMPAALQMAVTAFSNVFVQSYIYAFGADCMAGWSAYSKVDQFVTLPMQSISLAATTFIGQNVGARKTERTHQGAKTSILLGIVVTVVLTAVTLIFARPLIGLFNNKPTVLHYGAQFMYWMGSFVVLNCVNQVLAGILRGVGDSKGPMIILLGSFVVFRQVYLFVASHLTDSFVAVALGYPAGWLVCCIVLSLYYRRHIGRFIQAAEAQA